MGKSPPILFILAVFLLLVAGCAPSAQPASAPHAEATTSFLPLVVEGTPPPPPAKPGIIVYTLNGRLYRIQAAQGAAPEDLSRALDSLAPGADEWVNLSSNAAWLILSTERFDPACSGWACLVILPADLSSWEVVRVNGQVLHPAFSAIAPRGDLIVYADAGGPHAQDLWAINKSGGAWSDPLLLTAASPYEYNSLPDLSLNASRVFFDCGPVPYGQEGTAICDVGTDGENLRLILTPQQGPGGSAQNALHAPHDALDGSLVFEADWGGELLWRLPPTGEEPSPIRPDLTNDNSPCVLPDGSIASLWLNRPENPQGVHELKVMSADGTSYFMAVVDADVADIGLGCGGE